MNPAQLADELLRAAGGLSRFASSQAEIGAPAGLLRLLAIVEERGPIRIGDLALADHVSQPAVTRQVGRLEAFGWVHRSSDPDDARASLVTLAPAGQQALERARRVRGEVLAQVLADLDIGEDRVRDAVQLLTQLLDAARRVTPTATAVAEEV